MPTLINMCPSHISLNVGLLNSFNAIKHLIISSHFSKAIDRKENKIGVLIFSFSNQGSELFKGDELDRHLIWTSKNGLKGGFLTFLL